MWHIWRSKVRILQMSGHQEVVRNDQIDLKMNHTEQSRELEAFTQRKTDIKLGRLKLWVSPASFTLFLQGPHKSWKAVLHQRSATCKRTAPWARKRLDFISSPSPNAAVWLLPPSQVLWTLTSWDSTLFALSRSLMPFLILRVPKYLLSHQAPRECNYSYVYGSVCTHTTTQMHTDTLTPPDTWMQKTPLAHIHRPSTLTSQHPKHACRGARTSKREHPVV